MNEVGRNPAQIISVFEHFVGSDDSGRRIRGIGEPIYPSRSATALAEAQLHEALLNAPMLQDWDFWLGCPYDTSVLDCDVLDVMHATHPHVAGQRDHDIRTDTLLEDMFGAPLPAVPVDARRRFVIDADLGAAREFVRRSATELGHGDARLEDLICAVNEVVTNSMRHGDGTAVMSVWCTEDMLVCDVHDGGWIKDPLVGRLSPSATSTGGRGLWLANHLCDLVQVRSSGAGTTVRTFLAR
jgi:anti-sigma regulatory factor (Ser/Thr protein kinase)